MKTGKSLRGTLIVALVALALGPLLLVGVVQIWLSFDVQQHQAISLQEEISNSAVREFMRTIDELTADFGAVESIYDVTQLSPEKQRRFLSRLQAYTSVGYRNIVSQLTLVNSQGIERAKVSRTEIFAENQFIDRSGEPVFAYPMQTGDVYFSPIVIKAETGEPMMTLGIPWHDARTGKTNAVLIVEVRLKELLNFVTQTPVGESGVIYIVDEDSNLIAHPNTSLVLRGVQVRIPRTTGFQRGLSGDYASVTFEKIELGQSTLYLITELPIAEALGLTISTVVTITLITVMALVGSLFFGYVMARRIVLPVESLAATASAISHGDLSQKADENRDDEIGDLARAFNRMTKRLLETIDTLEHNLERIDRLANYDTLTGLPNRRLLENFIGKYIADAKRHDMNFALLFIDLDHFKTINDSLGHTAGDLLLQQVATRLKKEVRAEDTVARLGGDEFIVVLTEMLGSQETAVRSAKQVAEKVLKMLTEPYDLHGNYYRMTASVGVVMFPGYGETADDLLKQADTAMYSAKDAGRNAIYFYEREMQAAVDRRLALEKDLLAAIKADELFVYYQPEINNQGEMIGMEALIRWNHPIRGMVLPDQFIPLAEETGLIIPIGEWVLAKACSQFNYWLAIGQVTTLEYISVNVSYRQFRQYNFAEDIRRILAESGMSPKNLKMEITESIVMIDIEDAIQKIQALRKLGVKFSIDDFGTGYSSLSYLSRLPLDVLKIDQSFVQALPYRKNAAVIAETIIAMARHLGLGVTAEGVETEEQFKFLQEKGCDSYQGYFFSEAIAPDDFEYFVDLDLKKIETRIAPADQG